MSTGFMFPKRQNYLGSGAGEWEKNRIKEVIPLPLKIFNRDFELLRNDVIGPQIDQRVDFSGRGVERERRYR